MTTVISRVYSDEATADRVIEALSAEAWPAKWYEKIGGGKAAEDAIRAARVPESDVAAYAAMLTGGATMVVVRPEFNPRGAARRAMEIVDAEPSTPAPGVATQNAYIREKANPNLFNYGRILKDHPRFLSGDFKPGTGQRYALLSEAFYWRLLSEPKRRNSAMRPARFMSQKILPFPLLKDKAPSNSVISGGRRWLYNP